jgi:hypothetical protein
LFSLSREDERFAQENLQGVENWLIKDKKAEEPYLFAGKTPRLVSAGSKLLFSFDAQVFGKAIAKTDVDPVPLEEQEKRRKAGRYVYKNSIVLKGASCQLLKNYPAKQEIKEKLGVTCGRVFTYLTESQYNAIIDW